MLAKWTLLMRSLADGIEAFMASLESVLVSIIGRVACWLTPIPSAILLSRAADAVFNLGPSWSWVMAAIVEMLGLVTGNLYLTAREWDATKNQKDPLANERLAFWLLVAYFAVAEALLVAFQVVAIAQTGNLTGLVSLLFPGLSAVGQLALNERITHNRRVANKETRRVPVAKVAERGTYDIFVAEMAGRNGAGPLSVGEVMAAYGLPERTAYRWIERAKNGHGVEVLNG